jgi:hypothetical protein
MKTLNRITTIAIGTSLALTPVLAFADTNVQTTSGTQGGFLSGLYQRNEDTNNKGIDVKADFESSTSAEHDASSTEKDHSKKEHSNNGLHLGQGKNLEAHADASIDGRINALEKIEARLNSSTQLTATEKATFATMIQTQIDALTALKAKIGNDTSTSTMHDDKGTIRPEFRTYALVLPRITILAASDRLLSTASNMETVGAKLNTRITAASSSVNVTAARASYTDYVAKVADAKVQAQAAANLVVNLSSDNGNATVFAANTAALKAAKLKLDAARADLTAARKDMRDILKDLKIEHSDESHATTTAHTSI